MKSDWHEGCKKCQQEEEVGTTSLRQHYNRIASGTGDSVELLELSLGNDCNLSCRMCSPSFSTKWHKVLDENPELSDWHDRPDTGVNIDRILDGIDTQKLRWVKYLGGEPFITPELKVLINRLDQENVLERVTFMCHTNATLFPEKWIDILSKFKSISLKFSIDGYGKLNDYIRHGKEWDTIHSNILRWKNAGLSNLKLGIYPTVQAYNVHAMNDLQAYASLHRLDFSSAKLMGPRYLSINVLPPDYIASIRTDKKYLQHYEHNERDWKRFISYTNACDKAFGLTMEEVNPLLWSFMSSAA